MAATWRNRLFLGTALILIPLASWAQGRDPLLPDGVEAPAKGRDLILPPIINDTPAGAALPALPKPGDAESWQAAAPAPSAIQLPAETDARATPAPAEVAISKTNDRIVLGEGDTNSIPAEGLVTERTKPALAAAPAPKHQQTVTEVAEDSNRAPALERFKIEPAGVKSADAGLLAAATPAAMEKGMHPRLLADHWRVKLALDVGFGQHEAATQRFLASVPNGYVPGGNLNGALIDRVETDDKDDVVPVQAEVTLNLAGWVEPLRLTRGGSDVTPWLKVAVGGFDSDRELRRASFAPGAGRQLLLPGVGNDTGAVLAFLPNLTFANATARDLDFAAQDEVRFGHVLYGQTWDAGGFDFSGFGGIGYARREHTQRFAYRVEGTAPGPVNLGTGQYETELDSDTVSFILGVKANVPLGGRFALDGYAKASYDITDASGRDSLTHRNADGSVIAQRVNIEATDDSVGYGVGAGLNIAATEAVGIRLGVDYHSGETAAVFNRNGVDPTQTAFDRDQVVVGTVRTTFTF